MLSGLAGILPFHPKTFTDAWRNRRDSLKKLEEKQKKIQEESGQKQESSA